MNWRHLTIIISLLCFSQVRAQEFYISGGMGLNYLTMEKLNDYLHYNWNFNNRRDDSHSAIEFYALIGSKFTSNFTMETSFGYSLNSFSNNYGMGIYQLEYIFYYPEINFLYELNYTHYGIQGGFGIGYVMGSVEETQPVVIQKIVEETSGFNFQLKSTVYVSLDKNLFVELGVNYRLAFLNSLSGYNFRINHYPYENLNLSFNSFGIKLGVRYKL